ncbi:MAG: 6-carboxytetrahydropterin synthase [Elusimicrobia bacterium]|nr:6-carboxytetrahydropterin synthase [Elusimicrobiota bacterium]
MSYRIIKIIPFVYGHRLMNYPGKCRRLHGHSGRLEIVLEADALDGQGMVADFSKIKEKISGWLAANFDHRLILNKKDPWLGRLKKIDSSVAAVAFDPTAENLARMIFEKAKAMGLAVVEARLWETEASCAVYKETST